MRFTLSWLFDYLETDSSLDEILDSLTDIGLEVEQVIDRSKGLLEFTVAHIVDAQPHPNADRLRCCKVNIGSEILDIVCGAPNARAGINVVFAPIGSTIPNGNFKIKASEIRGSKSNGMLCSMKELFLGDDHDGIIEMHGSKEDIGKKFVDIYNLSDPIIDIAITPNRSDCLGVYGIARDLAATGIGKLKNLPIIEEVNGLFKSPISINNNELKESPLVLGCYIKNVKNGESPEWLQKRLKAIGQNSISRLVDITSFLTFNFGRPAHVYDAKKIKGDLTICKASKEENFKALNDKEYVLSEDMLVIRDEQEIVSIAGIIGGKDSGCSNETEDIFLEIALFNPITIANTGRKLDLITDARYRFERGVDPKFVNFAFDFAVNMILDLCGGEPSKKVVSGDTNFVEKKIKFSFDKVKEISSIDIPKAKISSILEDLGFKIDGDTITIPSWRFDIEQPIDLVEEVIRIYGYNKIPIIPLPKKSKSFQNKNNNDRNHINLSILLASRDMSEVITWSFMNEEKAKLFSSISPKLKLQNPISSDLDYMRPSILPNLLDAAKRNIDRGFKNLSFFEVGPIFNEENALLQEKNISGIRTGKTTEKDLFKSSRDFDIFDIKADLFFIIDKLGFTSENMNITSNAPSYYHPGRSALVMLGKSIIGIYGEIHPNIVNIFDVGAPVFAFEFFINNLPVAKSRKSFKKKRPFWSEYQKSVRDFAFIVPEETSVSSIIKTVKNCDKKLIQDVTLFDIYQGKNIESGKKSVAISVTIQAMDHTLTEKELEDINNKIINTVLKNCDSYLR